MSKDHTSRDVKCIPSTAHQRHFRIELRGQVDRSWMAAFDLVSFLSSTEITTMVVMADQAALRGIMNRLWDLNLDIHSVIAITWPVSLDGGK